VVSLVSRGLLKEIEVTRDCSLNKTFICEFLDQIILLGEVQVSDSLEHRLDH